MHCIQKMSPSKNYPKKFKKNWTGKDLDKICEDIASKAINLWTDKVFSDGYTIILLLYLKCKQTYGHTDIRTDSPSYRDATAHLKRKMIVLGPYFCTLANRILWAKRVVFSKVKKRRRALSSLCVHERVYARVRARKWVVVGRPEDGDLCAHRSCLNCV